MPKHRDAVKPEAEGEARVLFGIDTAVLENVRIDGTATADFHPACSLAAFAALAAAKDAAYVHFRGRFRKREEARAETRLYAFTEKLVHENLENALELCKGNRFIDDQAFALLEHRSVRRIVIDAENMSRRNHPERRLVRFHVMDLRIGRLRAKHDLVA